MNAQFLAKQYLSENPLVQVARPEPITDFLRSFDIFDDDLHDEVLYNVADLLALQYPLVTSQVTPSIIQ